MFPLLCWLQVLDVLNVNTRDIYCLVAALLAVELRLLPLLRVLQESAAAKDKEAYRGKGRAEVDKASRIVIRGLFFS